MSKLRLRLSISLDGYAAGPDQSVENPLGKGGMQLHEWVFPLKEFKAAHGGEGGETNASSAVVAEANRNIGATIMGRNMFGGGRGAWRSEAPWNGWWDEDPPFHHPVFVLTHHARAPLSLADTTFHFVTDGIEAALAQARRAAGDKDITLGGGAAAARAYLAAGLVDVMVLSLVPVLLGSGERLFDDGLTDLHGLTQTKTTVAPGVTHLHFVRR